MFDRTGKEVLLDKVNSKKDLGIILQSNLKFNGHTNIIAANKANKITELI